MQLSCLFFEHMRNTQTQENNNIDFWFKATIPVDVRVLFHKRTGMFW